MFLALTENVMQIHNSVLVNKFTDWESFRETLEERINLIVYLRNEGQLDDVVQTFITDIQ